MTEKNSKESKEGNYGGWMRDQLEIRKLMDITKTGVCPPPPKPD